MAAMHAPFMPIGFAAPALATANLPGTIIFRVKGRVNTPRQILSSGKNRKGGNFSVNDLS